MVNTKGITMDMGDSGVKTGQLDILNRALFVVTVDDENKTILSLDLHGAREGKVEVKMREIEEFNSVIVSVMAVQEKNGVENKTTRSISLPSDSHFFGACSASFEKGRLTINIPKCRPNSVAVSYNTK